MKPFLKIKHTLLSVDLCISGLLAVWPRPQGLLPFITQASRPRSHSDMHLRPRSLPCFYASSSATSPIRTQDVVQLIPTPHAWDPLEQSVAITDCRGIYALRPVDVYSLSLFLFFCSLPQVKAKSYRGRTNRSQGALALHRPPRNTRTEGTVVVVTDGSRAVGHAEPPHCSGS